MSRGAFVICKAVAPIQGNTRQAKPRQGSSPKLNINANESHGLSVSMSTMGFSRDSII